MSKSPGAVKNPRRIAAHALQVWENGHRHADDILTSFSRQAELSSADHALLQQLFYGVIRSLTRLDALIDRLRDGKLGLENRNLLRLGLYQLFDTRMPVHAAVNETVELARHRRDRSVINGVLRNADRKRDELAAYLAGQALAVRESHPDFLIDRWTQQFGAETAIELCEWNNQPPSVYLRINRLAATDTEKSNDSEIEETIRTTIANHERTTALDAHPDFFRIEGPVPKEWIQRGWIYLQDPSTRLACELLDPQAGEHVLDACAAPGGKAALMALSGAKITAVDRGDKRLERLHENLQRLRADKLVEVHGLDWLSDDLGQHFADTRFDAILLDLPCSNTGVMRRRVDVRWRLTSDGFAAQAEQQFRITQAALPLLKPGGRLVYSTCSIDPAENDGVIDRLVAAHPELSRESTVECLPWRDAFDGAFACRLRLRN